MRTLLFDADALAYRAAAANQRKYDWDGDGAAAVATDIDAAKEYMVGEIDGLMAHLQADKLVICLSDDVNNFRTGIDPTYKSNRASVDRPVHLYELKSWLQAEYPWDLRPTLEADDVMGILSTEPAPGEDRIIVSQDKDMQTIPGLLYRPYADKPQVQAISLEFADYFHMWQTLAGDAVDGYPGCPGVGKLGAEKHLTTLTGFADYTHVFKSGPRKGLEETRWREVEMTSQWEVVTSLFRKAGLTPRHAMIQARLARILRHGEWDGRPVLWRPPEAG